MKESDRSSVRQAVIYNLIMLTALIMAAALFAVPDCSYAEGTDKAVRVGWYESAFNRTDQFGRRSGYAYEYQRKVAAYTGWTYEYVEGTWPELLQKLEDGEIDILSDVSYVKEREDKMLYTSLPMGTESYYIFISKDDSDISPDDYKTLNGKRIGVNRDSIQNDLFMEWGRSHGVKAKLVEMTEPVEEALMMVKDGKLDAYLTMDFNGDPAE